MRCGVKGEVGVRLSLLDELGERSCSAREGEVFCLLLGVRADMAAESCPSGPGLAGGG